MGIYATEILNKPNNFTLLRHIAALFVLVSHSYELLGVGSREPLVRLTNGLISFSHIGLVMFFFISGFFVTKSLLDSNNIIHFLWKRILRIYPALFPLIFITVFVLGTLFTILPLKEYFLNEQTWQYFIGGVTLIRLRFYLPGVFNGEGVNGSLWSLPVEFRLYLLLALLFAVTFFRRKLLSIFVIAMFIFFFLFVNQEYISVPKWFDVYIYWGVYFFAGASVFFLKERIKLNILIFAALLVLWFFCSNIQGLNMLTELIVICYACLLVGLKMQPIKKLFFNQNDYSYSIYIYAYPIQQSIIFLLNHRISPVSLCLFTLAVLVPFCWISWRLIEQPALKMKNVFLRKVDE